MLSSLCISHLFKISVSTAGGNGLQASHYSAGLDIGFVVAMAAHSVHLNDE